MTSDEQFFRTISIYKELVKGKVLKTKKGDIAMADDFTVGYTMMSADKRPMISSMATLDFKTINRICEEEDIGFVI